jgi:hypothetical protein
MRKKVFIKLTLSILLLFNLAACSTVDKLIDNQPPQKRAFQEKPFSSDEWIKGDAQTRGEMARDLSKYETFESKIKGKSRSELIKILGEPDKKTTGKCCYIRSGEEVEVWLYEIDPPEFDAGGKKTKNNGVQIFFSNDGDDVMSINRGAMDEKPAHFPMVG